ncbi:ABC transporter iron(III)/siderophore-binding protein [Plantibacter sp. PA-3-X8]|uniref:ABC transporter substrate-binding protein n=1 Tax=Plantibacter sp. PA-3-X8 TaxID=2480625 RepID=UPI000F5DA568|nr:ABC transporter substrate-binding protein [Plantibacter sp. PA-3-X8]AZH84589.1 ABC transporter iron(III)/siderophore-binding protein [Plantibacter sp. PA-3-X8]
MNSPRQRRTALAVGSAFLLAALAGCSAQAAAPQAALTDGTKLTGGATSYPFTIDNCGYEQTFEKAPERVVLLNGASVSEVESMVMLGLSDAVLANAQNYGMSDSPELVEQIDALPTANLDMGSFDIPSEQLLALKPDLVISTWSGGFDADAGQATREELAGLGIESIVNPANCAMGKDDATDAERETFASATIESSFDFLNLVGNVFDVQAAAQALVDEQRQQIEAVSLAVDGADRPTGLIVFPGMSMMSANGLPAVMAGGIFDDVLERAGVTSSFANADTDLTENITEEQLAAADVQLLVVGGFMPGEDLDAAAAKIFAAYPQWEASRTNNYVKVSDGVYVGPTNAAAIDKIARAAHPDAF